MKIFYTKILVMDILLHENFQIYGMQHIERGGLWHLPYLICQTFVTPTCFVGSLRLLYHKIAHLFSFALVPNILLKQSTPPDARPSARGSAYVLCTQPLTNAFYFTVAFSARISIPYVLSSGQQDCHRMLSKNILRFLVQLSTNAYITGTSTLIEWNFTTLAAHTCIKERKGELSENIKIKLVGQSITEL